MTSCEYFISTNYYVVNISRRRPSRFYPLVRVAYGLLGRLSMTAWILERVIGRMPASKLFSPYVVCVADKPG